MKLTPGGNAPIQNHAVTVRVMSGAPVDVSSFRLYENGKVRGDLDMVFYGQPENQDRTVSYSASGNDSLFTVNLPALAADVQKIAFSATCDSKVISHLGKLAIQVEINGAVELVGEVDTSGRQEAALILGELYRRNGEWKFRFVSQGFNGGLKPLAEHFGVDISDNPAPVPAAAPAPAPAPAPASKVNLSKVSLTKEKPSISLTKRDDFGEIRVNLNWKQGGGGQKTGFLKGVFNNSNKGIDLDLGAFVELKDGYRCVVQALGNRFGDLAGEPYVQLQGDDRTGAISEGEWLHVNGRQWKELKEVLIFAYIYEGVASWENTEGVVTIHVPGQPPIETFMNEGNNRRNMCAIARLVNDGGSIRVERVNQFFSGHADMDKAFGWGFRWSAGSK